MNDVGLQYVQESFNWAGLIMSSIDDRLAAMSIDLFNISLSIWRFFKTMPLSGTYAISQYKDSFYEFHISFLSLNRP